MDPVMALEAAALAQQKPMLAAMAQGESEVQRFYNNSFIFLTGGSGFLGKQLIEKLLRCCRVTKVYMLLRPKKGHGVLERLNEILQDPVFDTIHKLQPNFRQKITAIKGDVAELNLGITNEDWKTLTEEVNIIFHVAATTRFDEALRTATLINVRGTREALLLGKACKNLRSYVHVSTAFSHATIDSIGGEILEKFYKAPVPPVSMILMAEEMENDRLENIKTTLIKGWPNTYTFTKAIGEEMVRTASFGLPVCIVRPSIVLGTYREPTSAWLDKSCLYGASGLLFGMSIGVIHVLLFDTDKKVDIIPCDFVNNAIIVAAKETAVNKGKGGSDTKIYSITTTNKNHAIYHKLFSDVIEGRQTYATPKAIYFIFNHCVKNKYWFAVLSLLYHIIPAYLADVVCLLMRKPRRFAKLANKLYKMNSKLSHFTLNEWMFNDDNLNKLYCSLSNQDKAIFNFDVTDIVWFKYITTFCSVGFRKYILKDGLKGTEYGIKKQKIWQIVHYLVVTLIFYFVFLLVKICF